MSYTLYHDSMSNVKFPNPTPNVQRPTPNVQQTPFDIGHWAFDIPYTLYPIPPNYSPFINAALKYFPCLDGVKFQSVKSIGDQ